MNPVGRPPMVFDQEIGDLLCAEIVTGFKSLRTICAKSGMPSVTTVLKWLRECPEFASQYARAKQEQAELMIEDTLEIADDGRNDTFTTEDGKVIVDTDVIQRSKLRVDTRKWLASKLLPKKYGEIGATTNVTVGVAISGITEEQRAITLAKKQEAIQWQREHREPKKLTNGNGNGTNGAH